MKKRTYPAKYPVKVGFARSVVVGNVVFVSGCSGQTLDTFHVDSDDVARQTEVALDKIRGALEEAGASMNDVIKNVIYLTRPEDHPLVAEKIEAYYRTHAPDLIEEPPVETVICIPALHEPALLVEIDSTAVMAG